MFDPYHKWLGVAPKDQPPNHYRLLGIDLFESDSDVIDAAANRQMAYLQQRATGKHAAVSQKLLNEIAAARLCLLNPEKKAGYDADLRPVLTHTNPPSRADGPKDLGATIEAPPPTGLPGTAPAVRSRRFEPWHIAAAAIGVTFLLLIIAWAVVSLNKRSSQMERPGLDADLAEMPVSSQSHEPVAQARASTESEEGMKPPPTLSSIRLSVSDLATWEVQGSKKPIGEVIEYDKADDCVRIPSSAVVANYALCKYDKYTVTFQYRRSTEAAWCNFYLQPNCVLGFGDPHGTGLLGASGEFSFVPLAGQSVMKEGQSMWLPPTEEAEKPLGQWNDVQIEIDLKRWTVTINGRLVHKADCSVFRPSPFWVQGGRGFEFRSIEIVPLPQ